MYHKNKKCFVVQNESVVERFGDVEIFDLTVHLMGLYDEQGRKFIPKFEVILQGDSNEKHL